MLHRSEDRRGRSALILATEGGHTDIMEMLLAARADVSRSRIPCAVSIDGERERERESERVREA